VLGADPLYLSYQHPATGRTYSYRLGDLLQPAAQRLDAAHNVLDIVYVREPHEQRVKEGLFVVRQRLGCEDFQQVAKVVSAVLSAA
jgi:hypothetical protein